MKPRHDPFAKKGETNVHDQSGHGAGLCPKCKQAIAPKPGFRPSALKCPKCGTSASKK